MRRPELLQGLRMMKFRDVHARYEGGRLSQIDAAELLGIPSQHG